MAERSVVGGIAPHRDAGARRDGREARDVRRKRARAAEDADGVLEDVHGEHRGWRWIANARFRALHLAAITLVAIEGVIGMTCPLTAWEAALRGESADQSFVARMLHAVVFHDFPEWVFTVAYVAFAIVTALTIRLVPVRPNR